MMLVHLAALLLPQSWRMRGHFPYSRPFPVSPLQFSFLNPDFLEPPHSPNSVFFVSCSVLGASLEVMLVGGYSIFLPASRACTAMTWIRG